MAAYAMICFVRFEEIDCALEPPQNSRTRLRLSSAGLMHGTLESGVVIRRRHRI
jgi:hypothetical protein